jgi:glycerol-3-phosphate dehydrogenase
VLDVALTTSEHERLHDVAIIGAGVVGCAIARALSHHHLDVALIDAANDVGTGTSKANSAILHTGFDAPEGSLEASLVARGHRLLAEYATNTGIPIRRSGATLVAWSENDVLSLGRVRSTAAANGYHAAVPLTAGEVYEREPHLAGGASGGLAIPDESIICPFTTPLAFGTEAVLNGVNLLLNRPVTAASRKSTGWCLTANGESINTKWVINAAGLNGDTIAQMLGDTPFTLTPRRGQFIIYDKAAAELAKGIVLGVPNPRSKGVLLTPTVLGNLLLGPTAEDLDDKTATETTAPGLSTLVKEGERILPLLADMEVTSTYSGLRAVSNKNGYDIAVDGEAGYARVSGIRSTGLSASMAIAEHLMNQLADAGLPLEPKTKLHQVTMPYIGEGRTRPSADDAAIAADPSAGTVICFCELTTLAELEAAAASPIPPVSIDGLFRRTRATGGRCQGFYCRADITAWLAGKLGRSTSDLLGVSGR